MLKEGKVKTIAMIFSMVFGLVFLGTMPYSFFSENTTDSSWAKAVPYVESTSTSKTRNVIIRLIILNLLTYTLNRFEPFIFKG